MLSVLLLMLAAIEPGSIEVSVQHLPDDRWRAEYRFDEPVQAVRFVRRFEHRAADWSIDTPGLELQRTGDVDLIIGDAPFDRMTIAFPSNTELLVKNYEFVNRFTDGSLLFYTGHLDVYPVEPDPAGGWDRAIRVDRQDRPEMDIRFTPLPGEKVTVPGTGGDRYRSAETGVYVYFGTLEPVASEHVVAFVDPGLPDDLRKTFDKYLPQLFELYRLRFGQALARRPTVYLGAVPADRGYSTRGGVSGGVVQLAVEADFDDPPPRLEERLVHLIAHEAAHLWNGYRFHHRQLRGSSWMHEGSADALAERALVEIGYYDRDQLAAKVSEQATLCARGLSEIRLINATESGRFDLMYECGAVVALLTGRGWSEGDLFDFWARLFAGADASGEYSVADYLGLVWQLAGKRTADDIYRLIHEPLEDPFEFMRAALEAAGISAELGSGAASDDQSGSSRALAHLVGQNCGGRYSIYAEANALKVLGLPDCALFADGNAYAVTHVQDHSTHQGIAVDAAISEHCGTDRPVMLTLAGGEVLKAPCPEPWTVDRRRVDVKL